jgi:hypothetical protein
LSILGGGLLTFLSGTAGCQADRNHTSYGPAFFGTVLGIAGANARTPQAAAVGSLAKDGFYLQAQMDNQRAAAREGRSEVIVNNNTTPTQNQIFHSPKNLFFSCNYFEDLNHDRLATYNEFIGNNKEKFTTAEPTMFVARIYDCPHIPFSLIVRNQKGEAIVERQFAGDEMGSFYTDVEGEFKSGRFQPGIYTGSWYMRDTFMGSSQIQIVP